MQNYFVKLLELKSLENNSESMFIEPKTSVQDAVDFYFKIDKFTSENIYTEIQNSDNYRYRMSFNSYFDKPRQEYVSSLTRTYLDHSEKIQFSCSEEYVEMLDSIRAVQDINDFEKLGFVSIKPEKESNKLEKIKIKTQNKANKTFSKALKLSFASLIITFIICLSFFNNHSISQTIINKSSIDKINIFYDEVYSAENKILLPNVDLSLNNQLINRPELPFIKIENKVSYSIPKGHVALTFDDGPSKYSMQIANILKEHDVAGTFFFLGENVKKYPESVKYIYLNGYGIGAHSMTHPVIPKLSYPKQKQEFYKSMEVVEEITGTPTTLFRPPYGSFNTYLEDLAKERNYKIVLWNNDTRDWESRNSDKIFETIKSKDVSGGIILLHESQHVVDALPRIIEYLKELDLKIVNLE